VNGSAEYVFAVSFCLTADIKQEAHMLQNSPNILANIYGSHGQRDMQIFW
jgi:hypothetical protein